MENHDILPNLNFHGHEWGRLQDWLQSELLDCYKTLARLDVTEVETHQLRGRVAIINKMLAWPSLYADFTSPQ